MTPDHWMGANCKLMSPSTAGIEIVQMKQENDIIKRIIYYAKMKPSIASIVCLHYTKTPHYYQLRRGEFGPGKQPRYWNEDGNT